MKITVSNFRAVQHAETAPSKLICILGPNQSGKTSMLQAVSAALRGDKKVYGATVADTSAVVAEGHSTAFCSVDFENGSSCSISWPGDALTGGNVPPVNDITMGLVDPAGSYDKKQWAEFIRSIMDTPAKITADMIRGRLEKIPHQTDELVKEALNAARGGLDAATAFCQSEARIGKREWSAVIGGTYGEKKAEEVAARYEQQVYGGDVDALSDQIEQVRAWRASALAAEGIEGQTIASLNNKIKLLEHQLQQQKYAHTCNAAIVRDVTASLEKLPAAMGDPLICPCCSGEVFLKNGSLVMGSPDASDEQVKDDRFRLEAELREQKKAENAALCDIEATKAAIIAHRSLVEAAQRISGKATDPAGRSSSELATMLEELVDKQKQIERLVGADYWHTRVQFFLGAAALFGPTGIRLDQMAEGLPQVQEHIDEIAAYLFPEHKVALCVEGDGIELTFDGRPYKALTWNGDPNSYALRIQYLFQIIQAQMLHEDAPVILDRLDTLEVQLIVRVLRCLIENDITAVIGRMMPVKPELDKLKKNGAGLTYWINSETHELEAV